MKRYLRIPVIPSITEIVLIFVLGLVTSCSDSNVYTSAFDNVNDRIWVGKDYWAIPLEDWKIEDGKLQCTGIEPQSRVNLLTHNLSPGKGSFKILLEGSLLDEGKIPGSAGLLIGVHDKEDSDIRAACYFGKGIHAGISLNGFAFLGDERSELPGGFDFSHFKIVVTGSDNQVTLTAEDFEGKKTKKLIVETKELQGLIAIASNLIHGGNETPGKSSFSFDKLEVSGTKIISNPENAFGPILWTMHTLNKNKLKIIAFLPPIGANDNQQVSLQVEKEGQWQNVDTQTIEPDSRTVVFSVNSWDSSQDNGYRVEYLMKAKDGTETAEYYTGTIRRDPIDKPLKFGGLTCQYSSGFPYTPLVKNLDLLEPDILYFSGDQIYEANGGYPIKREPENVSILSYLGKYYMFGWAFGNLMRDRPTICTPDDHDVFHGNLWGESGKAMPPGSRIGTVGGYIQSAKMVNVVNRTQCGQLPDPYDPTPVDRGISVWYTSLNYGRISFAIISDRQFKTGPQTVSNWERNDHLKEVPKDPSILDNPNLKMVGDRQLKFLTEWIEDWENTDMKVLLSQTVFANAATHHGSKDGSFDGFLVGDLDSGGWPKSARDEVIRLMRKAAVFHINGDQHLPTIVQYGLDDYRDGGYSFCTPPISSIYVRWFLPDEVGYPVLDRPEHGYPNTGKYTDGFGNKNYVYAVGNPGDIITDPNSRYNESQLRASGFGMITFDQTERTIAIDAWRFLANVENPNPVRDQFPGWPFRISVYDNFGLNAAYVLPEFVIDEPDQLVQIRNEKTNELVQIFRLNGNKIQPKLHNTGTFTVTVGEGEMIKKITGIKPGFKSNNQSVSINLN